MKTFLQTYVTILIVVECFLFFGGYQLFDFNRHFFRAGAACAFLIAAVLTGFLAQSKKLEELEKRLQDLERDAEKPV